MHRNRALRGASPHGIPADVTVGLARCPKCAGSGRRAAPLRTPLTLRPADWLGRLAWDADYGSALCLVTCRTCAGHGTLASFTCAPEAFVESRAPASTIGHG